MSGTSLDGADAVLVDFSNTVPCLLAHSHVPFDPDLRARLLALTVDGPGEIENAGRLGNELAALYAEGVRTVLSSGGVSRRDVLATGCHGQTVRHRPEHGFTLQLGNPALLAELTGITVVADFRSRDVAAGGQGAPLVPAFHAAMFGHPTEGRAILNVGGIANLTLMPHGSAVRGFDTGPGNCLMDLWVQRHLGVPVDAKGNWASGSPPLATLLARLLDEPYFSRPAPKSCGRELFNDGWLTPALDGTENPQAVQATLLELTVESVARALADEIPHLARLIVCGGGARNSAFMARLAQRMTPLPVESSDRYGLDVEQVEATAFAWLGKLALEERPGNLPEVTGARGRRVLGAIYRA